MAAAASPPMSLLQETRSATLQLAADDRLGRVVAGGRRVDQPANVPIEHTDFTQIRRGRATGRGESIQGVVGQH
eukprot:8416385-Alexandrium_andersonii.AAC.1